MPPSIEAFVHILLIHQAFAALDEPGGTRHHELARHLVQRGHRVTIITSPVSYLTGKARAGRSRWVERQQDGPQITILRSYTYPALHRSFVHRILSFLSFMVSSFLIGLGVRKVDLVWGTSPPIFQGITAWLLSRLKRAPFLFEVRDLWPAFAVAVRVLQQPLLIRLSEWLERFLYRRAKVVVVNSPGYIEHVRQRGAKRVELVPNGAETGMFNPLEDGLAFRRQHGLEGKYIALYAGAHGMSNDLGVVLQAAKQLRDQPEIAFVLLGDGKEKPKLIAQAQEMGLSNVHFLPPVSKTSMPTALAAADVCLAILKPIELYKTTYPNKVFDYLAAGRPVVLAIDGVIRQVIEAAEAGIPVPPGDPEAMASAIRSLWQHPETGRQMGRCARQYVETHFDRAQLADRLAELMLELTATP
jgi:glycosyltransferase involved in cell wall biosynthesis